MKNSKLAKFGIVSLAAITLGVVAPVVAPVTFGSNVVYAEEAKPESFEVLVGYFGNTGNNLIDVAPEGAITITPSNPYTVKHPQVDGWEPDKAFLNPIRGEGRFAEEGEVLSYDSFKNDGITDIFNISYTYTPAKTPTDQPETPAEQPQTNPEVPATKPETPAEKPSDKPAEKPTEEPAKPAQPETPANKPAEEPEKPADKPDEPAKPEVPTTPETPAEKPSDKPVEKPTTPEKPTEKPATKPTDTNKPVVKPADNGKPEVKPENKVELKAEVKPEKQAGTAAANAQTPAPKAETKAPAAAAPKADKPAEKKMETLPNTGESQSALALLGLALGVLGLQGLTYKGRHDRKR